jgi:two-component system, sensor histidine kinase and response regulator
LPKPLRLEEMAEVIEKWAGGGQRKQASSQEKFPAGENGGFDWKRLVDRLMGDKRLAKELVVEFLKETPREIAPIKEAIARSDGKLAEIKAHNLKSVAADIGGASLSQVAMTVEKACEEGALEKAAGYLPKIEEEFGNFKKAIEKVL